MTDKITLPGVSDEDNRTLNRLRGELRAKQPMNFLRSSYYDGKRAIRQVGSVVPPHYYRMGIVLGWSAKGVDTLARRCNFERFTWADGDLDSLGVRETVNANRLTSEISAGLVSSLIHGPAFLINTRGDESVGEHPGLIHVKDALSATGDWNPRTRRLDNLLSITSWDQDEPTSLALYLDGYTIYAECDGGRWSSTRTEHPWGVPAEPLVYKPNPMRPFGTSRISRAAMSIHDAALRTLIRLEGHMDVYSFPEMWLLGADEAMFKNPDGSQKAAWQVMLGRIKAIPDDDSAPQGLERASVQQFSASSPEPHLAVLNAHAKQFARELSLPDTAVAISDIANPTSAESYDASQHELIAEAEGATSDWSIPVQRTMARALAMTNGLERVPDEWLSIEAKWRDPRFLSKASQADAGMKQLAAVPWLADSEVGLELLGLTDQQIRQALADRRRMNGSPALLAVRAAAAAREAAALAAAPVTDAVDG